jgi:hypothetical protein
LIPKMILFKTNLWFEQQFDQLINQLIVQQLPSNLWSFLHFYWVTLANWVELVNSLLVLSLPQWDEWMVFDMIMMMMIWWWFDDEFMIWWDDMVGDHHHHNHFCHVVIMMGWPSLSSHPTWHDMS